MCVRALKEAHSFAVLYNWSNNMYAKHLEKPYRSVAFCTSYEYEPKLRQLSELSAHVLEVSEPRLERHHTIFAQAVDRRVGHLAKVLAEEMAKRAIAFR